MSVGQWVCDATILFGFNGGVGWPQHTVCWDHPGLCLQGDFFFFWPPQCGLWDLSYPTRDQTQAPQQWKHWILPTTRLPGNSYSRVIINKCYRLKNTLFCKMDFVGYRKKEILLNLSFLAPLFCKVLLSLWTLFGTNSLISSVHWGFQRRLAERVFFSNFCF